MTVTSFGQVIPVTGPNIGFPGTIARFGERVIAARVFSPITAANNLNFGDPAVVVPSTGTGVLSTDGTFDSIADFVATIANTAKVPGYFAGMAVREVKTSLTYPSGTPGIQQVGYYSNGQMAEVLERGSGTVLLAVGSPSQGSQVYTRLVLNGAVAAGLVGDWETNPAATDQFAVATTLTEGSTAATVASGTNIQVGMLISGPGIQGGGTPGSVATYVAAVSGTSVTLSQAATATFASTGSVLTFSNLFAIPGCVARTGFVDANGVLEITFKNRLAA